MGVGEMALFCKHLGVWFIGYAFSPGPPSIPTLYCHDLSESVSEAVNVTLSWTLSNRNIADFYLINITIPTLPRLHMMDF